MFEPPRISRDAIDAKVFKNPPQPALSAVAAALLIFVVGILNPSSGRPDDLFVMIASWNAGRCIAALFILYYLWCLVRPVTLIANASGFALTGGFVWSSEVQRWDDIEHFFVTAKAGKMRVACALKPASERHFRARHGASNAKAIFAGFYPADPGQVVAELNALWRRAVGYTAAVVDISTNGVTADRRTGATAVEPETIRSSRWLYVITLGIFLVSVVFLVWCNIKIGFLDAAHLLIFVMALAPLILGALWLALHPPVLILDGNGFTMAGGFARSPKRTCWKDVEDFFVYNPPKNYFPKIAYDPRSNDRSESDFRKWALQKVLSFFLVYNPDDAVNQLNAYRQRALRLASSRA